MLELRAEAVTPKNAPSGFRESMALLHTWAGVIIGSLLFAIFWMGTLSLFDREIDRWMMPDTLLAAPMGTISLDPFIPIGLQTTSTEITRWQFRLPTERSPTLRFSYRDNGKKIVRDVNPLTGQIIADQGTKAGTGFIFPFHFSLNIKWRNLGYWLVGFAGMTMLLLLISGVVIHRKLFTEFFTFRRDTKIQRSALDLHNLTGVAALPFHFIITLSGLIIFMGIYFPSAHWGAYSKDAKASYNLEALGKFSRDKTHLPGQLSSIDTMLAQAEQEWAGGKPYLVRVWNPFDAGAYVEVRRSYANDVTMNFDQLYFDGASGALLHRFEASPVMKAQRFITGLHFIQFEHWPLRFLYFFGGLSGCVMIATGFLFWMESRRKHLSRSRLSRSGAGGVHMIEGLVVGSITGIIIATLAFFISNRLLPLKVSVAGIDRAALEVWVFFLSWIACFVHGGWRTVSAWREQCWVISVFAFCAVMLNALSTPDHLLRTLWQGNWAIAGIDLALLLCSLLGLFVAHKLQPGLVSLVSRSV
jgi:uncharacterized iron-regulated membrane protein